MITASLLRRRSRMLIALLSIAIGATILSGLVTIYYDVPRQMGAQFRGYGANMILLPEDGESLTMESAERALAAIDQAQLIGATPYRYVRLDMVKRQQSFMAAGTDFTEVQKTSPYFQVEGRYPESGREVLVGKSIADTIGTKLNGVMELTYKPTSTAASGETDQEALVSGATLSGSAEGWGEGLVYVTVRLDENAFIESIEVDISTQTPEISGPCAEESFTGQFTGQSIPVTDVDAVTGATMTSEAIVQAVNSAQTVSASAPTVERTINFTVVGILDTGGDEENYVFLSQSDMVALTGEVGVLDVMELSVSAAQEELEQYITAIDADNEGVTAQLVRRVTRSETAVLSKLQALVFLVTAVVLLLTMICVSTTMMAVISERRKEIGLRKALGASDNSIRLEFLGEGMFLGLLGGVLGALLGFVFAQVVSVNVFGSSITFQPLLLPITMLVSTVVAGASCLVPIRNAVAIDPALVLKGE